MMFNCEEHGVQHDRDWCPFCRIMELEEDIQTAIGLLKVADENLGFYRALHDAGAYTRLAAAAKERLDEYVNKYNELKSSGR